MGIQTCKITLYALPFHAHRRGNRTWLEEDDGLKTAALGVVRRKLSEPAHHILYVMHLGGLLGPATQSHQGIGMKPEHGRGGLGKDAAFLESRQRGHQVGGHRPLSHVQ